MEVAQEKAAASGMVREVTERLHELRPAAVVIASAGVAVELLIVFNEWLN